MWLTEFGAVDRTVFLVMVVLSFMNLVYGLLVLILVFKFRNGIAGTSMDFYISCGCLVLTFSVILRGLSSTYINFSEFAILCQAFPSVMMVGLLWVSGGLLVKTSAVLHFYKDLYGEEAVSHEWKPNLWLMPLMIVDVAVVFAWVIGFSPVAVENRVDPAGVYRCGGGLSPEFQLGVSAYHALLLVIAAALVWPARYYAKGTDCSDEMTSIILVVYNLVVVSVAAALIHGYFELDASTMYAAIGGIMQYAIFTTLTGLLVGKILSARKYHANRKMTGAKRGWIDMPDIPEEPCAHSVSDKASSSARYSSARGSDSGSDYSGSYLETVPTRPDDSGDDEHPYILPIS